MVDPRPPHDPLGAADPAGPAAPDHLRDLGMDPAVGKYRSDEAETAQRVEQQLGIRLRRAAGGKVDWIGPDGETYDAVGNFDTRLIVPPSAPAPE